MSASPHTFKLRYFASLREALGIDGETVASSAATAAELRRELMARGGAYADALAPGKAVRMAVNQVMAKDDQTLPEGAEVAFFPPVTGG